jgi:hypothetical protein
MPEINGPIRSKFKAKEGAQVFLEGPSAQFKSLLCCQTARPADLGGPKARRR